MESGGTKFDDGKERYDLVPRFAQEQYVKILTRGAIKYGERNWEKGLKWSRLIAAIKRHLQSYENGEDLDKESGLYHMAHVMCNAAFLLEYYRIYPEGDDRKNHIRSSPNIGLDVDGVLADFTGQYIIKYGNSGNDKNNKNNMHIDSWGFDPKLNERLKELSNDKDFWMSITPLISPKDIPFEPCCYITSRLCPIEWTVEWLHKYGFPNADRAYSATNSKVDIAKEYGVEWFIDDRYENYIQLNNAGICCYLFDSPHNKRYNVAGHKRIKSFYDIPLFNK